MFVSGARAGRDYPQRMSRTHSILATALLCAAASACGANVSHAPVRATYSTQIPDGPVQVRNLDGDALPSYALADAGAYIEVECRNGQVYQIVDRSKDLYNLSLMHTSAGNAGLNGICDRVRNSRLDHDHLH
jgi:hypothetical protein